MHLANKTGQELSFWTFHYLESQSQGASFIPRLIGFLTKQDRAFFELFTSVRGIGNRKALRAMALPVSTIATAIADKDTGILVSLPEIGRRTAETLIVELREKMAPFLDATGDRKDSPIVEIGHGRIANDALAALLQLGETRSMAVQWIDRALHDEPDIEQAEVLVAAAYRFKHASG
jgi:Holliday junction DNA helicase RuvA